MSKNRTEMKVLKICVLLSVIISFIFLVFISVDYSLVIGWIVGSISILFGYFIGILFMNIFFKKKNIGFLVGIIKFYINLFLQGAIFIFVIYINNVFNNHNFMEGDLKDMFYPINIFTYIGGISIVLISTFIVQIFERKKLKNDK